MLWSQPLLRTSRLSVLLTLLVSLGAGRAAAQATAEYAGATSKVAATATKAETAAKAEAKTEKFTHLPIRTNEVPDVTNRRALEERAGPDAGQLMLRSVPSKAQVRIDGKVVGNTPLLLILAPGSYRVEIESERMDHARREVDLLPREKREVLLSLEPRYPSHVRLRLGSRPIQLR